MIRREGLESPLGQAAWIHYQTWMRAGHKLVPSVKSFLHSKFFNAFMKFAKFAKEVRVPDPDLYIRYMIALDAPPAMWTCDPIYVAFIEHMDKKIPAIKNARITIETLFNTAEDMNCGVNEVFNNIDPNDLIQLLRQRKLSPWLLLRSKKFLTFLRARTNQDQRIVLETIIRPKVWAEKLKNNIEDVKAIDKFVEALDL